MPVIAVIGAKWGDEGKGKIVDLLAEEVRAIVNFVRTELGQQPIDLLPYNRMGESKYERLDKEPILLESQPEEYIQELQEIVRTSS